MMNGMHRKQRSLSVCGFLFFALVAPIALAQKTDTVHLKNGDSLTVEVKTIEQCVEMAVEMHESTNVIRRILRNFGE